MPAKIQRYRSPYFTGDTSASYASATFRTELRYRRAAPFLIDEGYESSGDKQAMVYVPLDQSGLDHDFYLYKYAATPGTISGIDSNGADAYLPIGADSSGNWQNWAAACSDYQFRNKSIQTNACGALGASNANSTTQTVRSYVGDTVTSGNGWANYGNAWTSCRNTVFNDVHGDQYSLYLTTNAEWVKAADWGDLSLDGNITVNPNASLIGKTVNTVEGSSSTYSSSQFCNTNTNGTAANDGTLSGYPVGFAGCISRYGASQMVGNNEEYVADAFFGQCGIDNGLDSLMLGFQLRSGVPSQASYYMDLLRGVPPASNSAGSYISVNYDGLLGYGAGLSAIIRNGANNNQEAGRWFIAGSGALTYSAAFRCVY